MRWLNRILAAIALVALATPGLILLAQPTAAPQAVEAGAPQDTLTVGQAAFSRAHMLLEKTIFKVNVLTVDVRLSDRDAGQIERVAAGQRYSRALEDSIAEIFIYSRDAWVKIEFVRDVSFNQFLDGVDDNLRHVSRAGIISRGDYEEILGNLPRWFGFLEERRILKGDQIHYRIHGDSLRTVFRAVSGEILLDQTDAGAVPRLAVLGGYFVQKSEFREKLVKSLFE